MTGTIECAACSSRNVFAVDEWPTGKRARAMACRDCGLLFVEDLSAHDASIANNGNLDALWAPHGTSTASKKGAAHALMAALERQGAEAGHPAGSRVLSIGSGAGSWLNVFRDRGWETFGIGSAADQPGTPHQLLSGVPTDARFDLVIAYHVLERAHRPLDALNALARSIRPGGHCFVCVPRLDALVDHRQPRYCLQPGKVVAAFTESCLRGLLARAGLEVVTAVHNLGHGSAPEDSQRVRLLARRVESAPPEPNPAAALEPILNVLPSLGLASKAEAPPVVPDPTSCPSCDGADVHFVEEWRLPGRESRAAACRDCGLLFVHPQPTPAELDAYYAPDGGWRASRIERHVAEAGSPQNKTEGAAASIFPALDRFLRTTHPPAGARVFDFGCGQGAWLNSFQDRGWDTYGLEPSTDVAFSRHKRVQSVPSESQFDLVIVYHVLEHLPRPLDTLRELARALVPGGYCLVSVPRIDTLAVHRQVDYCLHPRHHIVGYTEACMRGLLARAGLEVVQSLHALDSAWSKGMPVRLQLLARKAEGPLPVEAGAAAALAPVIAAYAALRAPGSSSPARPRAANE